MLRAGTYKVSADGKTLTVTNKGGGLKGPYEVVMGVRAGRPGSLLARSMLRQVADDVLAGHPLRVPDAGGKPRIHDSCGACRWPSASAPTAPSSASPTRCSSGRFQSRGRARCSASAPIPRSKRFNASSLVSSYRDYVDIRDQEEFRRSGRLHLPHRRLRDRSDGDAEAEEWAAGRAATCCR